MNTELENLKLHEKLINNILPASATVDISDFMALNHLCQSVHQVNVEMGWWTNLKYQKQMSIIGNSKLSDDEKKELADALGISVTSDRNVGELLCLVHSEISEAMEGFRKNLMDDKLKDKKMFDVELADAVIRIFDICGRHNIKLGSLMAEKIAFNVHRPDHKLENRLKENGKKF